MVDTIDIGHIRQKNCFLNTALLDLTTPDKKKRKNKNFYFFRCLQMGSGILDKYELGGIVGEGSYGTVHRARNRYTSWEYHLRSNHFRGRAWNEPLF